ncbi:DUF929 family protein [Nocardioides sp. BP30]|uniref:DUF929 family protein n=1 Tax=Nocardioides sp. BP30 TaxID=3036374 RepID=UPI0024691520|nr:DUF929 family protein [Nocardioides sp. BP30]WGL51591.1 DUF929 family protein [Nocardioides sp. BP30]
MTGKAKKEPQGATPAPDQTPSRNAAKAARREAMRAQMLRDQAKARRTARLKTTGVVAIVVVIVVAVGVGIGLSIGGGGGGKGSASTALDSSVEKAITGVSGDVIDAVGAGGGVSISKPVALSGAPALTSDGKPRVLYVGAEYCPYCAAQRWAVVNALSRFGTFTHLGQTTSSASDIDPSTATLSFHGATYTSDYLSFTGVEQTTNQPDGNGGYKPLDSLSAADQKILDTYDTKQYVGSDGGIPFIDYGGKYASSGASYDPATLQGLSHADIAKDLSDPSSTVTKSIVGTANVITATLCKLTDQKPANVCTAAGVKAAAS